VELVEIAIAVAGIALLAAVGVRVFGQGIATAYLVALVLTWGRWRRPAVAAALTVGLTLALLGHFGVFLSLLVIIPLIVIVLIARGGTTIHGQAIALLGSFVVAVFLSWALYYHFHNALLFGHISSFLGGDTNARGSADSTIGERVRNEWNGLLAWWGWPALSLALVGINLFRRGRGGPPLTVALTWLGTALPFLALAVIAGLSVRFHLFVAPALGVAVGWALWRFWQLHRFVGPAFCIAIAFLWGWQSMAYWVDRVLHAYH
jgi:hypothetical protein